jgi:hypothetical protein
MSNFVERIAGLDVVQAGVSNKVSGFHGSSLLSFKPSGRFRALKQSQFSGPVGKRQAQPLHIGMTGQELRFDFRDLAAATLDSS